MAAALHTTVLAVHRDAEHRFFKLQEDAIELEAGLGVVGDAHHGLTVRHRSRAKADPFQPNLRQVHLISASLFDHLADLGFDVGPGELGENVTLASAPGLTWDALIALPVGTQLHFAQGAVVELTGLRNPCIQLDRDQNGLMAAMLDRDATGRVRRKAGVMGVVQAGGAIASGDAVRVRLPRAPHRPMGCV
ncbi:MOSC domain-containing protein [Pulveribacter suum]|uniref:MOSC domain-containing protein n=1 Tax=Pulveribacter suum TaxID=2116657 RepID=A0A2P1NLI2_9BURK|nr:MOSC domain-containing protein [Pulveribacter suum]AVP57929.1 MOSC domain-containing protein [Pulveribacter suum]